MRPKPHTATTRISLIEIVISRKVFGSYLTSYSRCVTDKPDNRGKLGGSPVPPVGHPLREEALAFLGLSFSASDREAEDVLLTLAGTDADNNPIGPMDPRVREYYDRFVEPREPQPIRWVLYLTNSQEARLDEHRLRGKEKRGLRDTEEHELLDDDDLWDAQLLPRDRLDHRHTRFIAIVEERRDPSTGRMVELLVPVSPEDQSQSYKAHVIRMNERSFAELVEALKPILPDTAEGSRRSRLQYSLAGSKGKEDEQLFLFFKLDWLLKPDYLADFIQITRTAQRSGGLTDEQRGLVAKATSIIEAFRSHFDAPGGGRRSGGTASERITASVREEMRTDRAAAEPLVRSYVERRRMPSARSGLLTAVSSLFGIPVASLETSLRGEKRFDLASAPPREIEAAVVWLKWHDEIDGLRRSHVREAFAAPRTRRDT